MAKVDKISNQPLGLSQQDPALSGDGEKLAVIVDKNRRPSVQLKDLRNGRIIPLRYLSRHQPHSSPSLSWNGRYLAVIAQRGNRRLPIIEDRITGRIHQLTIPGEHVPIRLSLAPDGGQLALQYADNGTWRVRIFNLTNMLEPDQPSGFIRSNTKEDIGI